MSVKTLFDVIVTGSSIQNRTTLFEASRIEKTPEISGVSGRILSINVLPFQSFLTIACALLVFVFVAGEIHKGLALEISILN